MSSFEEVMAKFVAGEEGAQAELDVLVVERVAAGIEDEVRTLRGHNDLLIGEYALNGCDGCGRKDPGWKSNVLRALERRGLLQESKE